MKAPTVDGQIQVYRDGEFSDSKPRIIYVNGIQTSGPVHLQTALMLSQITQRPIIGVYNKTSGSDAKGWMLDLLQCGSDWLNSFASQLGEFSFDGLNTIINKVRSWTGDDVTKASDVAADLRKKVPQPALVAFLTKYLSATNSASAALFQELHAFRGERQLIVAHSQGNLVTASALWALQTVHGAQGLANLQIYSVASPAPAWPAGINFQIKVYGHVNDVVTLADPKNHFPGRRSQGDWRLHGSLPKAVIPGVDGHDISVNFFGTNFVSRIRSDLGLEPMQDTTGQAQPYLPGDKVHVVNSGESLSLIAKKYYGKPHLWNQIYTRNRQVIGADPNRVQVGARLIIPPAPPS